MQGRLTTFLLAVFLTLSGEIGRNKEMSLLFIGTSLGFLHQEKERLEAEESDEDDSENATTEEDPLLLEQSEDFENG